jgi:hypothetical protein
MNIQKILFPTSSYTTFHAFMDGLIIAFIIAFLAFI